MSRRVERPALSSALPAISDVAPAPPAGDIVPEELRLLAHAATARLAGASGPRLPPPPSAPAPDAWPALQHLAARLASEELDQRALSVLDDAGRATLAPRLVAVREMAKTVSHLLGLRDEATSTLRAGGQG